MIPAIQIAILEVCLLKRPELIRNKDFEWL